MTSVLFDTEALVRALEGLFRGMWRDVTSGRLPRPDLSNLAEYLEIGSGFALDGAAPADGAALAARWRDALARRDAFSPLMPDQRLWRAAPHAAAA